MQRDFIRSLEKAIGVEKVSTRWIDRLALSSDASFYSLVPACIVRPTTAEDVASLLRLAGEHRLPLTFRAAGTSLSGQAISDSVLVDISRSFRDVQILDEGRRIRLQPGVTGQRANDHLRRYGRKIGPDPASIQAAMLGGILANNSSGMCCGVTQNAYHTLDAMTIVLPDGSRFNTETAADADRFRDEHASLYNGLLEIRSRILTDEAIRDRIRDKYRIKNTVGYGMNAFLDFDRPLDILAHLMIGSEGTLGFIADATLRTVPASKHKLTTLLLFRDLHAAGAAVPELLDAAAVEIMDRSAIRSIEKKAAPLAGVLSAAPEEAAALLVEFEFATAAELDEHKPDIARRLSDFSLLVAPSLTDDVQQQALYWSLRKGMYPSVGSLRPKGSSALIEDVAVPVRHLADLCADLQRLFKTYAYDEAIIFGHAKDGNLHFVITPTFPSDAEVQRYEALMNDVVDLVVHKYDGALKGEHGTGRNMAPFVETEWGDVIYALMKEVKRLVDPVNICNPGVIINDDRRVHLANLKPLPAVHDEVDLCIECGFCENRCPSRDLTLTPRQRIVVQRLLQDPRRSALRPEILKDYAYSGVDTCATDGLCATACPVGIDTGRYMKDLRAQKQGPLSKRVAQFVSTHMKLISLFIGLSLRPLSVPGMSRVGRLVTNVVRLMVRIPQLPVSMRGAARITAKGDSDADILYFPTCISRTMGGYADAPSIPETIERLVRRSGLQMRVASDTSGHCCGTPMASKGFPEAAEHSLSALVEMLFRESEGGRIPVVLDTSSCTYALVQRAAASDNGDAIGRKLHALRIMDSVVFVAEMLLPRLRVTKRQESIALHPTCASQKMNHLAYLQTVAAACADSVVVPISAGCCGMAGDRGMLFPELTASATREEAEQMRNEHCSGHYSSARTCELALTEATGRAYHSVLHLLDRATE